VPDFLKWAESYGAHGIRVTKQEDIIPALEAAKANTDAPTLIEFMIATEELVLPMVPGGAPMNKMILNSK
jgi:acetolactate synthase-1/2/3 large subunit